MIKISIIVPVYNTSKYLKKCLDSCLNQTLKDIELIVINDGSTDNSEEIIKTYKDKRIKYISKKNEGIGKTRNLGIKKATGEFLGFIDSDDYISENFCKVMYEKAKKDECEVVISNFYYDYGNNNYKEFNMISFSDSNLNKNPKLLYDINLGPCNKIYNRKMIIENKICFEEKLKYEDITFVCKALSKANKIGKIEQYLSYYVIHENSQTTIRDEKVFDIFKICNQIKNIFQDNKNIEFYLNKMLIRIIIDYMVQQRYQQEKKLVNVFINEAYEYLDKLDPNWKKNEIFNKLGKTESFVVKNKPILKLYCRFYK